MPREHVLVGFSGGMDSCAAVHLLRSEGYRVTAVHLILYEKSLEATSKCLRQLADLLNIPLIIVDKRSIFQDTIIRPFAESYLSGNTPNPCVWCNEEIKLRALSELMPSQDAAWIATGHYAKKGFDPDCQRWFIRRGRDREKDQSYFLSFVSQGHLKRLLLPLADKKKEEIRELMVKLSLPIPNDSESHEICFLEGNAYTNLISAQLHPPMGSKGTFINAKGEVLGTHNGVYRFTVGQRRGIGIADKTPYYVTALYPDTNQVQIGKVNELYKSRFYIRNCRWHLYPAGDRLTAFCQIRYRHAASPAHLRILSANRVEVTFTIPQRAIAPGQIAAFYHDDRLIGAGVIDKIYS